MKLSPKHVTLLMFFLFFHNIYAQSEESIWRKTPSNRIIKQKGDRPIVPKSFSLYQVDFPLLKEQLNKAPEQSNESAGLTVSIPSPSGIQKFVVSKTETMPKIHQADGADIQTFFGYKEGNPHVWITLDYTNHGFHAMISGAENGDYFIDPYQLNDTENYLVYYRNSFNKSIPFECLVEDESLVDEFESDAVLFENLQNKSAVETDCQLRTYRIAIACSGEYTAYHGGTQALAQSGIATTIDRVNQIFRRDLGVVLNIVSGSSIIYLDSVTDPFINGDIYQMLDTNSYLIPGMIGSANFDIGHVFGTAGLLSGGLATRDGVCQAGDKSGGVTTFEDPIGDQFDIDFVAHEIGHQIAGRHTFNAQIGACAGWLQRSDIGAYEPGSGSTIMAYAGLCNQTGLSADIQDFSDALFHSYNISEISKSLITGNASECGVVSPAGNNKPIADAGPVFYNLPANTPFQLTGNSTDVDAGDVHTYSWEQYDLAPSAQHIPVSTSIDQPNFRMFEPTLNKTRYFPMMDSIVANVNWPKFEQIPSVSRSMKFRLTVRDNSPGGCGCTDFDEVDLNFDGTSGPFLVTNPNVTGISWTAETTENITWDVAGTDNAPISCTNVDILLSVDGGFTYPHVLALNVPNDGSHDITVPNIGTSTGRIKIICSDNIFFDISDSDFTIVPLPITEPEISFQTVYLDAFEENTPDGNLDCRSYKDYTVIMQIANPPSGNATVTINPGGNATSGLDYNIIGSPLVFPSGAVSDQMFTIRVIDDGEVDPLENVELSYTITGGTDAVSASNNQMCLIKIHDDEHAPYSGVLPHFEENFNSGVTFGIGVNNWNDSNNSGGEAWTLGSGGDISGSGQSLFISDNGATNSYNTSNSYSYVSIESPEINGAGKSNQVLSFEYVSEGDAGHDFGRVMYSLGAGVSLIEGGVNAPFADQSVKKNAEILLPPDVDGANYTLSWGWTNSVTNPGGQVGKAFEIDNIKVTEGTPGIRIETEVTTVTDEQYLGPFQSIYFYDPNDSKLMLYIQNTSSHDYGCTTVEVDRAGSGATEFQFVDPMLDVTDKSYRVIPSNNNSAGTYTVTLYYSEEEIAGWEASTGNSRNDLEIVKSIGAISTVTPASPQTATTFYQPATLGAFGSDLTLTSTFSNGFSGFAAGIHIIPLPIELVTFDAYIVNNRYVQLDWVTITEINNDFFTIERSVDGIHWELVTTIQGAGNSTNTLSYTTDDHSPFRGVSYYRLKQTDFDGSHKYSHVEAVKFDQNTVMIFPNLAHESFTIQGSEEELNEVTIFNTAGQNITSMLSIEKLSKEKLKVNISRLSAGMYYVKTKTTINKLCKQ